MEDISKEVAIAMVIFIGVILFLMAGLAIILYINCITNEPRTHDEESQNAREYGRNASEYGRNPSKYGATDSPGSGGIQYLTFAQKKRKARRARVWGGEAPVQGVEVEDVEREDEKLDLFWERFDRECGRLDRDDEVWRVEGERLKREEERLLVERERLDGEERRVECEWERLEGMLGGMERL